MGQSNRALIFLLMAFMGVWAIAQSNDPEQAELLERILNLENGMVQKAASEQELIREQEAIRQTLVSTEKTVARLEEEKAGLESQIVQLQELVKERNQLRTDLAERTAERNGMEDRCEQLKKGLLQLLEKDEVAAKTTGQPNQKATLSSKSPNAPGSLTNRRKANEAADPKDSVRPQ